MLEGRRRTLRDSWKLERLSLLKVPEKARKVFVVREQ